MIICTTCGAENQDDSLQCAACGRKLQSGRRAAEQGGPEEPRPLPMLGREEGSPAVRGELARYLEGLVYALVLAGAAVASLLLGDWLVLWIAAPLVGLAAWLRRI